MKEIRFYDFDFNRLGDFTHFVSLNVQKNYCGFGTAELHFSVSEADVIPLLENNKYLFFVAGEHTVIVTGWKIGDDIAVFGRTPEWLLSKRGVEPIERTTGTVGEIAAIVVGKAAGDFIVVDDKTNFGKVMTYSTEGVRNLHDVVCEVLKSDSLGFEVDVDFTEKAFVFKVILGVEQPLLLSVSSRTAFDVNYTVERQSAVTSSGWYERKFEDMGEWNADTNSPRIYNSKEENFGTFYKIASSYYNRFGLECVEGEFLYCDTVDGTWKTGKEKPDTFWVYVENTGVSGARKWDAVLKGVKTGDEGELEILSLKPVTTISAESIKSEYEKDYCVGDVVRVQVEIGKFKKSEKKRVESVCFYYDVDKSGSVPILSSLEV